ncbi:MAG: branched-chain amino acid transport system substrate-binding protein [Solirubrobacteraceae bacterium]|nr:branched-chain amino acid transport system substrate-binding protein [Solirubrobacteraceae bacterium]
MRVKAAAVAFAAALALAGAGCGNNGGGSSSGGGAGGGASAPGVTKTTVTVGGHFPLTGPAAPGYSEIPRAIEAYFKQVNANGGIHGRQLKFITRDDGYNPTNTVKVTRQLVLQDKVFAVVGGLGTPTHSKVVDFLNTSKVPDLFVSSGCLCWNDPSAHPYTFGWQTDYVTEGKILGQYIANTYKGKKVAYFVQNDDFGTDGEKGLDQFIPKGDVVARQTYEPGNVDIGPQIAKIKASGAEVLAMFTIPAYTALTTLAGVKLNYKPQMVVSNVGADATTLGGLLKAFSKGKAGSSLVDGLQSASYLPALGDTSNPWIKLFKGIHDKYLANLPWDGNVLYGMALGYTFAEALQDAGQNPTRQSIVDAVQSGKLRGPGLVPLRYSKSDHSGYGGEQLSHIQGGAAVLDGKPMTTDTGTGSISESTESQPSPPANGVPTG